MFVPSVYIRKRLCYWFTKFILSFCEVTSTQAIHHFTISICNVVSKFTNLMMVRVEVNEEITVTQGVWTKNWHQSPQNTRTASNAVITKNKFTSIFSYKVHPDIDFTDESVV